MTKRLSTLRLVHVPEPPMSSNSQAVLPTVNDPKVSLPVPASTTARAAKRTTKAAQKVGYFRRECFKELTLIKLQVLPDTPEPVTQSQVLDDARLALDSDEPDAELLLQDISPAEDDFEVYQQIAQIPEGTARSDALKLTKKTIKLLPRVTAHCTAR